MANPATETSPIGTLRETGLLWLINRQVFHPRGFALALDMNPETGEVFGWQLLGDGSEPWTFGDDETQHFANVEALLHDLAKRH